MKFLEARLSAEEVPEKLPVLHAREPGLVLVHVDVRELGQARARQDLEDLGALLGASLSFVREALKV